MGEPPVVIAAQVNVENIHAGFDKVFHVFQGLADGSALREVFQALYGVHPFTVGLVQRAGQINAVHDGEVTAGTPAQLFDDFNAEALPVRVLAQLAAVEGGVGHLIQQIALVTVEIHAVQPHCLGVRRALAEVFDDFIQLHIRQWAAGNLRDIEVGVP